MEKKLAIISRSSSSSLSINIAEAMNIELVPVDLKIFPDGESNIRLMKNIEGLVVVLANIDDNLCYQHGLHFRQNCIYIEIITQFNLIHEDLMKIVYI